jgi:acyl-CoA dehydrogenase
MTDLDSFRAETRAWLDANCPDEMRGWTAVPSS